MNTQDNPSNSTGERSSLLSRIRSGSPLKKEKGGGPLAASSRQVSEDSGAQDPSSSRRVRLYVEKIGKNKNLLLARRMHDPEGELVQVGCKDAKAFRVRSYIEAEADADGRLYIVEEKRWLRFQK